MKISVCFFRNIEKAYEHKSKIPDQAYVVLFGKKQTKKLIEKAKQELGELDNAFKVYNSKLDGMLKKLYSNSPKTPEKISFIEFKSLFVNQLKDSFDLNEIVYGFREMQKDILEFVQNEKEFLSFFRTKLALRDTLELKISKDRKQLMEIAEFGGSIMFSLLSRYHELFADVTAVLMNKNDGKTIYNALMHTTPNKFRSGRTEKQFDERDFSNRENRIDKFEPIGSGHGFFAAVRYHLWENYLQQPKYATFEGRGLVADNVLRAIYSILSKALTAERMTDPRFFRDLDTAALQQNIGKILKDQANDKTLKSEVKINPMLNLIIKADQQYRHEHGLGNGVEKKKVIDLNKRLIQAIDKEFESNYL